MTGLYSVTEPFGVTRRFRAIPGLLSLLVAMAVIGVGCSDDPVAPPPGGGPEPAIGRYLLEGVDAQPLPATIIDETVPSESGDFQLRIDIVSGYFDVLPDDRYQKSLTITVYIDGHPAPETWFDAGGFALVGNTLRFDSDHIQNLTFEGTVVNGELDVSQDLLRHFHNVGRVTRFRFALAD